MCRDKIAKEATDAAAKKKKERSLKMNNQIFSSVEKGTYGKSQKNKHAKQEATKSYAACRR